MNLSWEAVILAAFILVPGFTYASTAAIFSAPERLKPSDLQLSLRSLAASSALIALEIALLLVLALLWSDLRNEIEKLAQTGFEDYAKQQPVRVPLFLTTLLLANMALMAGLGWSRLLDKFLRHQQGKRGISSYRVWVDIVDSISLDEAPIGARVHLTAGGTYWGALANWSLVGEPQGGPDLALWRPHFRANENAEWEPRGRAVVIPAREVKCFELYTADQEHAVEEQTGTTGHD